MDTSRTPARLTRPRSRMRSRVWLGIGTVLAVAIGGLTAPPAFAAPPGNDPTAAFSGTTGTAQVGGTLYAKSGATLTLAVQAPKSPECVVVGAPINETTRVAGGATQWSWTTMAASTEGVHTVSVVTYSNVDNSAERQCKGNVDSLTASYRVDNTGPTVTRTLSPAPNAAGWSNADTTVAWSATDAGAGVATGPTPPSHSVTADGIQTLSAAAADRLGNTGSGTVTVRLDKTAPTITATQTAAGDGRTTISFTCADALSGITSCFANGSSTAALTVDAGTTVTGTATDLAGNTATVSSTAPVRDTTPPLLTGSPTTNPNSAGWYSGDVTIAWNASDPESGVTTHPPATTVIEGEGVNLTSSASATNGVGLTTNATSSPAVRIDRTAPATGITGASNSWNRGAVAVSLAATDNLSGVERTEYAIGRAAWQTGTTFTLTEDGEYDIAYRSIDRAGNTETVQTATVRIDSVAPTIAHRFIPSDYVDGGWTNHPVTVTFECADQGGSGVASCTPPVGVTDEGTTPVAGSAADGAGNTATTRATVRLDTTAPTITADVVGTPNSAGWYRQRPVVRFTAVDPLSGIASTSEPVTVPEGARRSATGTATDNAGNSATKTVTGLDVDTTPPTLEAEFDTRWHTRNATVRWLCSDGLSGVATPPADSTVTGEGADLSATAACSDAAGNTVDRTVTGIRIDRTAPTTQASASEPAASGWHVEPVEVTLAAGDNLSGVAATAYTVDGGEPQVYDGPFTISTDGRHTIRFWSTDVAGNDEAPGAPLVLDVDQTAPTTELISPISPDSGWFVTTGIPFAFTATDATSGVDATYFTIDDGPRRTYGGEFTETLATGTHVVKFWSVDLAGVAEPVSQANIVTVNVDTVPPTISGTVSPAANAHGWHNAAVDVTFTCADEHSGVSSLAGCVGDTRVTNEGVTEEIVGTAVDVAGNRTDATVGPIRIDTIRPTLVGVPDDANAVGWYKDDVRVQWRGSDGGSGIDPDTQPAASVILGEGRGLGAGPVTIQDKAGNTSLQARVDGINIDRTAPTVTGAPTTEPNEHGWYNSPVDVEFACEDDLSGVASCPGAATISTNGERQSVTSVPAFDLAGNEGSATVSGISIDTLAPQTSSATTCEKKFGFCVGEMATVELTASDQEGLSGVDEIRFQVDGGPLQTRAGGTASVDVPLTGTGSGTVSYFAVDRAGNAEEMREVSLKWDNLAPVVRGTASPVPNAAGWSNSDVAVSFAAEDEIGGSGVVEASVTAPVHLSTETSSTIVQGEARDLVGNLGTGSVEVKLDKTAPTIGASVSGPTGDNGWYTGPVTVRFACDDGRSGVASCPSDRTLTENGTQDVTGTAADRAGNTASTSVTGIKIDSQGPTLTHDKVNVNGQLYTLGDVPAPTCTATDSHAGVAGCTVTVTGGTASGVGTFRYTATATDRAGNPTTISGEYRVKYRFDGFLQPINDTAHQVDATTSVFKAGSTIPVKFQLKKANGDIVTASSAPIWVTPAIGSATSAPVSESVYSVTSDTGLTFRADGQQYIYNWKSGSKSGNYWRIGVKLDDGQTYCVTIGLR